MGQRIFRLRIDADFDPDAEGDLQQELELWVDELHSVLPVEVFEAEIEEVE